MVVKLKSILLKLLVGAKKMELNIGLLEIHVNLIR